MEDENLETKLNKISSNVDEETQKLLDGALRIISVEKEIKNLREDIKIIKKDLKEDGVDVKNLSKAIGNLKKDYKDRQNVDLANIKDIEELIKDSDEVYIHLEALMGV